MYLAHWACSHSWSAGTVSRLGLGYTCLLAFVLVAVRYLRTAMELVGSGYGYQS